LQKDHASDWTDRNRAAVVGFAATLITGDDSYTYRAGLVAVAVLLIAIRYAGHGERRFAALFADQKWVKFA